MIKCCLKIGSIARINQNIFTYSRVLSITDVSPCKRFCSGDNSRHKRQERRGKSVYLHRYGTELTEMQLIKYENRFQNQRYHKLSPIKASDYKTWLTTVCLDEENNSLQFERKFRRIQTICKTYNDILEKTFRVPSNLTTNDIQDLIECPIEDITKQINFLYEREMIRWTGKQFRSEEVVKNKERLDLKHKGRTSRIGIFDENSKEIVYGLWHNSLFSRIELKARKNYVSRTRLKTSALFGQKVVIDFGFEEFLYKISAKQLMSYLVKTLSFNKYNLEEPFDIHFNNLNDSGFMIKLMDKFFNNKHLIQYYIDFKDDSYLNYFDFADLCYICPQAEEPLQEYDHNAIYVLPGVVHNRMDPPLSMSRVKREGIQMKRIPVENYGIMKDGYHLEVHDSLKILSHFRDFNDMNKALELFVPKTVWKPTTEETFVEEYDKSVVKKLFYEKMIKTQKETKIYRTDI